MKNRQPTQAQKVLARLKAADGGWVSMPALVEASGAYAIHSRVSELRSYGHEIENHVLRFDGLALSFYRLNGEAE